MDFKKELKLIKDLKGRMKKQSSSIRSYDPCIEFIKGDFTLLFEGSENAIAFEEAIEHFWTIDKEIFNTLNKKTVQGQIVNLLAESVEGEEITIEKVKRVFSELKKADIHHCEVLYPLYGVNFSEEKPLEIGPYTIYNKNIHMSTLEQKYPSAEKVIGHEWEEFLEMDELHDVLIGVRENVRDFTRAASKARIKLERFENAIRFIIADRSKRVDVGVFNFNKHKFISAITLSEDRVAKSHKSSGAIEDFPLTESFINNEKYGDDKIWSMLERDKPTKLEERIITAIDWVGKGLRDEESTRSFIQYMFGLEALLQLQQRGVMVSPSITYQISEFAAFILGRNTEERLKIEKIFKDLYATRSAIAHGGSVKVTKKELNDSLYLIKSIISILLTNENFSDIKTIEQLNEWVKIKKYS